jgi:hypothetical protein
MSRAATRFASSSSSAPSRLPPTATAALLWSATRNETVRSSGAAAIVEARHLVDAMLAAAPSGWPELERLRPQLGA